MIYSNPDIKSSYQMNDLGKTIYEFVLEKKPNRVIEFGCLHGYSTVCIAMALKELGGGKLICYDLWDDYTYNHTTMSETIENVNKYGLNEYVDFIKKDYMDWLESPEDFDIMHLDISNTGDTILNTYQKLKPFIESGSSILFEGGSVERDNIDWMIKYNAKTINSVKDQVGYKIINDKFPSISVIQNEKI
jgi:predicted O-methyltransferase YrrM